MTMKALGLLCSLALLLGTLTGPVLGEEAARKAPELSLGAKIARYAPTDVTADISRLSEPDRKALAKIIEAARVMDRIFLRQVWPGNVALREKLKADATPAGQERFHYFKINVGPWSRLDNNEPFIDGVPARPPQAGFYAGDLTKEEFNGWVKTLPEAQQKKATGFFHVVRRGADKKLQLVPYSQEYKEFLEPAAKLLKEAAGLTTSPSLKSYLTGRADAFGSDDYYASDVAWMELDAPLDITIGPYETYEDELFGYKAAFEAFVTLRDDQETAKLTKFEGQLQDLENRLPIDAGYRNAKIGAMAPIRVVQEVFTAGDANRGVQTAAFNLPNDEKVIKEKGSKRVMLKNVQEAKFDKVLVPISRLVMAPEQQAEISFDAFFTHILMHELLHGLGPHDITVDGQKTTVRHAMKEIYSAIEEAKADTTGLWGMQQLLDRGVVDKKLERSMYTTFLASSFRSVRFGINEAHGKGVVMIFNYLTDEGAFKVDGAGLFFVDHTKIQAAVSKLTTRILTIQAEGSYAKAKALLDEYVKIRPPMQKALDKLRDVPVDIEPRFPVAARLAPEQSW